MAQNDKIEGIHQQMNETMKTQTQRIEGIATNFSTDITNAMETQRVTFEASMRALIMGGGTGGGTAAQPEAAAVLKVPAGPHPEESAAKGQRLG